jgi:uncharacterized protein YecT (DUF1311 family)
VKVQTSLLALLAFVALCPGSVEANQPKGARDNCSSLQASNLEYTECWQDRARKARSKADATYARARQIADKSDLQESYGGEPRTWLTASLKQSQAEWLKYYDRQCLFEGRIARGGTGTRALVAKCQLRLSTERIAELESPIKLTKELM